MIGYGLTWLLNSQSAGTAGAALLSMAVFGAVISYFMQMVSFIRLRSKMPDIERPYRSPVGVVGAGSRRVDRADLTGRACSSTTPTSRGSTGSPSGSPSASSTSGSPGRNKLVLSPEEEFAMTRGEHGRPEEEGYGTTSVAETTET